MIMKTRLEDKVQNAQASVKKTIKTKMFDLISAAIIITLIAISLGIIERRIITWTEIGNIVVEFIPFFLAFVLLGNNHYMKGSYAGKDTTKFINTCNDYGDVVSELTDEQIDSLDEFCEEYNEQALKRKQESYLKRAAITYDKFDKNSKDYVALKLRTNKELRAKFGKERAKWIIAAKNASVKGIRTNTLMGTNDSDDVTDIGLTESQLASSHKIKTSVSYAISTCVMMFIAVKDVISWHWFGFALVVFKCVFILCKSYVEYFAGYNDVTIHLVNHTNRKIDILKQYRHWFSEHKKREVVKENQTEESSEPTQLQMVIN